jgi:hypothetical protein
MNTTTVPLTDAERLVLGWYRDGDPRAEGVPEKLRDSLVDRRLLIRLAPPGGPLFALSPRARRALDAA